MRADTLRARAIPLGGLLLLAILLPACSTSPMKSDKSDLAWQARRARLTQIERFSLEARISSGLAMRGNLSWKQLPDEFAMRVAGPFGIGAANISGRGQEIEITTSKGTFKTADPERDLHDRLGWTFPVSHLRYWVLGVPAPGAEPAMEIDTQGRLVTLEQDDWTVQYAEYQQAGALELPRKLEVANSEVRIKVVVDTWAGLK